jgi:hypothetical protein
MAPSGMLRRVALVRTDISEELSSSVLRLLVAASVVPSSPILVTLMMEELSSSETFVLTRATRRYIPEDAILQSPVTVAAYPVDSRFTFIMYTALTCYCLTGKSISGLQPRKAYRRAQVLRKSGATCWP